VREADSRDGHETLGRSFRTPAQPEFVEALGRAVFNFLYLEEIVSTIVNEAGASSSPSETRRSAAEGKVKALRKLEGRYRRHPRGAEAADALKAATDVFEEQRQEVRNALLHAHPFTAGTDEHGNYLPGLAHTEGSGRAWRTVASSPEDLLDLAARIETALDPLNTARMAVGCLPITDLET
jgi:hypothetical protein